MSRSLTRSLSLLFVCLSSCAPPDEAGALPAPLVGGVPDGPSRGSSSAVALMMGGGDTNCSGVLIAPRLVLTAGHCAALYSAELGSLVQAVVRDGTRTSLVDRCHLHPRAIAGETECGFQLFSSGVRTQSDLALLELRTALDGVTPRPLSPPRSCLRTRDVPIIIRGYASAETRGRRRGVALARVRDRSGVDADEAELVRADGAVFNTEPGDSGGPYVELEFDGEPGPVLAVTSKNFANPLIWSAANQAWLWSVIDPDGRCALGASGPCQPLGFDAPLPDSDLDGLPDVRDLCPTVPVARACGGQHCDADGDFVGDECDAFDGVDGATGAPNAEVVACDYDDEDGDGLLAPLDPCPQIHASRTDPTDSDADGIPDVCDVCPGLDDGSVDFAADADGDGVPDECDNCDDAANPLQLDCNLDAELALWAERCPIGPGGEPSCPRSDFVRGDACDPTPCGETQVGREVHGRRGARRVVQDAVRVDARAALEREARTGFRFCRCRFVSRDSLEQRIVCRVEDTFVPAPCDPLTEPCPPTITIGGCGPLGGDDYDISPEPRSWRWPTMAFARDPARPAGPRTPPAARTERALRYQPIASDGLFETDLWAAWSLRDDDVPRWRAAFTEPIEAGPVATLPGVLWTHTPGPSTGGPATEWERDLASHFWSGTPRMSTAPPLPARRPAPCVVPITPLIARGVFGPVPIPWLGFATLDCPLVLPELSVVVRAGRDVFEPQSGLDPSWLAPFEAPGRRWVAASETGAWLPEQGLRYAGLSLVDLRLLARLEQRDGGLVDAIEPPGCAPGQCDPVPPPASARASASASASGSAPSAPRSAPRLVLSARRRTLWAIEPEALAPGAARLRALDLDRETWRDLAALGARLGRVLAVTYSASEDALLVLDEVEVGRGRWRRARLLRVDVDRLTARAEVVARWWRWTHNDRFTLSVDPSGAVYLAATRRRGHVSAIVRLEASRRGRYRPTAFGVRAGRFAEGGLRASEHGLTLVLEDRRRGAMPVSVALRALRGRGGIRRCL